MYSRKNTQQGAGAVLLLITALIWGCAFVAQSVGMKYIGPMTFTFIRFFMGTVMLLPVTFFEDEVRRSRAAGIGRQDQAALETAFSWKNKDLLIGGLLTGTFLFIASALQQYGLKYTSPGKAGFITAFYIIFVPIANWLIFKKRCSYKIWISVAAAFVGLYFLSISGVSRIETGDIIIFISALFYTGQILSVDHFSRRVDGIKLSCVQFAVSAALGLIFTVILEKPDMKQILNAAVPLLYTGILSTGLAYTLQIIGQKGISPTLASLLMSLESVFATLASFIILGDALSGREILGCLIMFGAIILAQLPDTKTTKRSPDSV